MNSECKYGFTIRFMAASLIGCNERCLCFKHNFTWCKRKCAIKVVTDWKIFNQTHPIVRKRPSHIHDFHLFFIVHPLRIRRWHAIINVKIPEPHKWICDIQIQIHKQLLHRFLSNFHALTHKVLIPEYHAMCRCVRVRKKGRGWERKWMKKWVRNYCIFASFEQKCWKIIEKVTERSWHGNIMK